MKNIELKLFIGLSRTLNNLNRQLNEVFRKHGLTTGQFAVLEALLHKGDRTVGELQSLILSTTGNMPVLIRNLTNMGYIESHKLENDKRCTLISLTSLGRKKIEETFPENKAVIEEFFSKLTEDEKTSLLNILRKYKEK